MDTFHIKLDMDKSRPIINEPVSVRQGDSDVTTIIAEIYDHGEPAGGLDKGIAFRYIRPNGSKYIETKGITLNGNTITFTTTGKLNREPGMIKIAHFTIGGDSTQDFVIDVRPGVFLTDDDYIKVVSSFKDKIRGDLSSNPNFILRTQLAGYFGYPADAVPKWYFGSNNADILKDDEIPQLFYRDYSKTPLFLGPNHDNGFAVVMYCFKCNPSSRKIVINNFNFAPIKTWGYNLVGTWPAGRLVFIANGVMNIQNMYNQPRPIISGDKIRVVQISNTINDAGFEVLKKDTNQQVTDFAIDLTKVNPLTEDGYLILITSIAQNGNHEFSDDYFPRNDSDNRYWHSRTDAEPPATPQPPFAPNIQNANLSPIPLSMTCTQYYLPD